MGFDPYRQEARGLLSASLKTSGAVVLGFVLMALLRPHLGSVDAFVVALVIVLAAELILLLVLRRHRSVSR